MSLWTRGGKLIINSSGKLIDCDHCPCEEGAGLTVSWLAATKTAGVTVPGFRRSGEYGEEVEVFPVQSQVNGIIEFHGSELMTAFPNVPEYEWMEWCTQIEPPLSPEDAARLSAEVAGALGAVNDRIREGIFIIDTSRVSHTAINTREATIIPEATSCTGSTDVDGARSQATQTTLAFFVSAEHAPVKKENGICYVGATFNVSINGTPATIPLITSAAQYSSIRVPEISTVFGSLPQVEFSDRCYAEQAFDPETGQITYGRWPMGAFANDSNYFPAVTTVHAASIKLVGVSSWREVNGNDPEVILSRCN